MAMSQDFRGRQTGETDGRRQPDVPLCQPAPVGRSSRVPARLCEKLVLCAVFFSYVCRTTGPSQSELSFHEESSPPPAVTPRQGVV